MRSAPVVTAETRRPFRAAPADGPDAFGIVILPARGGLPPRDPAPRPSLRALLARRGERG